MLLTRPTRARDRGGWVRRRWLVTGSVLAGGLALAGLGAVPGVAAAASHSGTPDAPTLYREALATTRSWSVHYVSSSTESQVSLLESGDAGPASGTQSVATGQGNLNDTITIQVIGGLTYVKGNVGGLEVLAGLSATEAVQTAGQWIEFSTTDSAFSQVVDGVRSHDVADELQLKGPLTLGHARTLNGIAVDAIDGTQTYTNHKSTHIVLYVRAHGSHVPVEEDALDANGKTSSTLHITYSHWGETVRPEAPQGAVPLGPVSAV
jgi:hypothetical protein